MSDDARSNSLYATAKVIPLPDPLLDISTEPHCSNCRYAKVVEAPKPQGVVDLSRSQPQSILLCRRFPPMAQAVPTSHGMAVIAVDFPQTAPDSWCGEYEYDDANG